jgi:hypothetical protein
MKKPPVEELIMSRLFATRKDTDPNDWQTHVRRNIVQEVRAETLRFYGPTDCLEAQYPGLDYNKRDHRLRLSHFPYHRRLLRVFDQLRLVDSEIQVLCKWEGTRWAREQYQKKNRTIIIDTTWDGVVVLKASLIAATQSSLRGGHVETGAGDFSDMMDAREENEERAGSVEEEEVSDEDSEDEMERSVGVELNQRLLAATEARARGEDVIIDADWEQWLKEAAERGIHPGISQVAESSSRVVDTPQSSLYRGHEIPELHSGNPTPEMVALQHSLPQPPIDFPEARIP